MRTARRPAGRESIGAALEASRRPLDARYQAAAAAQLGEAAFAAARAEGRAMPLEQAVADALESAPHPCWQGACVGGKPPSCGAWGWRRGRPSPEKLA